MPSTPENNRPLSRAAVEAAIEEMLGKGECSVTDEREGKIFRLRPTKIGQRKKKSATIEEINKVILKHGFELDEEKKKRIYRRKKDLPDPTRAHDDSTNRTTKQLAVRIDPATADRFNELAARFPSKREAFERAIELLEQEANEGVRPEPKNG